MSAQHMTRDRLDMAMGPYTWGDLLFAAAYAGVVWAWALGII